MAGNHARLSASSAYRWMNCKGAPALIDQHGTDTTDEYAAEGAAAHELGSRSLENGHSPNVYLGEKIEADGFTFTVDEEMVEAVTLYTDEVRYLVDQHDDAVLLVEVNLTEALKELHPEFGGMADAVVYLPSKKELHVYDYKHGAGVLVEVKDNPQLKYYALGALLALGDRPVENVFIEIVQPRRDHPDGPARGDKVAAVDLIDFAADIIKTAKETEDPWAPLNPGDWCKFCPVAHACPALEKHQTEIVAMDSDVVENLPAEQLARAMDILPMVEARVKAIRERAYQEAMHGTLPGYKIVEKRATRKWSKGEAELLEALSISSAIQKDDFYERKLKSPAQVEKLLGKSNFKELEDELVEKKSSGYNLVPDSDPKPAAMLASTDDFEEVKDE